MGNKVSSVKKDICADSVKLSELKIGSKYKIPKGGKSGKLTRCYTLKKKYQDSDPKYIALEFDTGLKSPYTAWEEKKRKKFDPPCYVPCKTRKARKTLS